MQPERNRNMKRTWILSDAHTHFGTDKERQEREQAGIVSLLCASTPGEAQKLFSRTGTCLIPTCGLHPWYAETYCIQDMAGWLESCPVIGEIGMDSVWCHVPLPVQEQMFRQQLELAARLGKPVILHTKGQEQKIAAIIREYPNRYLVHWYSGQDYLEEYLRMDCYISAGPDVGWNPAVRQAVRKTPLNRLLIETDGMESVKWAWREGQKAFGERKRAAKNPLGTEPESELISEFHPEVGPEPGGGAAAALERILEITAGIKGISPKAGGKQFRDNLMNGFLGGLVLKDQWKGQTEA